MKLRYFRERNVLNEGQLSKVPVLAVNLPQRRHTVAGWFTDQGVDGGAKSRRTRFQRKVRRGSWLVVRTRRGALDVDYNSPLLYMASLKVT